MTKKQIFFRILYLIVLVFSIAVLIICIINEHKQSINSDIAFKGSFTGLLIIMYIPTLISEFIAVKGMCALSEHLYKYKSEKIIRIVLITLSILIVIYTFLMYYYFCFNSDSFVYIWEYTYPFVSVWVGMTISMMLELSLIVLRKVHQNQENKGQISD